TNMRRCISTRSPSESTGTGGRSLANAAAEVRSGVTNAVLYWSVHEPGRPMTAEIEIPDSFPASGDVTGKRVVITGAGRGLGRLLPHAFSQGGAMVTLVARTETDLKELAAELPGPAVVV